jgi:hypothetical protein
MTSADPELPPADLRQLDQALADIRFRPRASLGAEIAGRARAGGAQEGRRSGFPRRLPLLAACLAGLVLAGWAGWTRTLVTVDRCCYDLDGGSERDDGVLVLARRNEEIRRLAVYEDRDGSRSYSEGDVLRFARGPVPTVLEATGDLVTTHHCCLDFDGGGPEDDGLLVVGVPPDRVMMVAVYEESRGRFESGYPLR